MKTPKTPKKFIQIYGDGSTFIHVDEIIRFERDNLTWIMEKDKVGTKVYLKDENTIYTNIKVEDFNNLVIQAQKE